MSNPVLLPVTAQQMEQMVSPQWRSGSAAEFELACVRRLQNVSAQRIHAEKGQKEQDNAGLQVLPPCSWHAPKKP